MPIVVANLLSMRWRIRGVDRTTGEHREFHAEADTEADASKAAGTALLIKSIEASPTGRDEEDVKSLGSPVLPSGVTHTILAAVLMLAAVVTLFIAIATQDEGVRSAAGVACVFFTLVACTTMILRQLDRIRFGICWLTNERWLRRRN